MILLKGISMTRNVYYGCRISKDDTTPRELSLIFLQDGENRDHFNCLNSHGEVHLYCTLSASSAEELQRTVVAKRDNALRSKGWPQVIDFPYKIIREQWGQYKLSFPLNYDIWLEGTYVCKCGTNMYVQYDKDTPMEFRACQVPDGFHIIENLNGIKDPNCVRGK